VRLPPEHPPDLVGSIWPMHKRIPGIGHGPYRYPTVGGDSH
jgi:hypothetical protein